MFPDSLPVVFGAGISSALGILTWFVRRSVSEIDNRHAALVAEVATLRATHGTYAVELGRVDERLKSINSRLDELLRRLPYPGNEHHG